MKKILFVIGSLRAKSFNRQLAEEAKKMIGQQAEVVELDYSGLPLMNQDVEQPEPEAVTRVRQAVQEADALWIFSPEYNFSYPGHVKNLIDWLSRPVKPMDYQTPTCINGKRVTLSGAGGKATTANCRQKLTELLTFVKADVLSVQTGVTLQPECWTDDVLRLSDDDRQHLAAQVEAVLR